MTTLPTTLGPRWNRVLAAEWLKEITLRSTWWTLGVLAIAVAGSGLVTTVGILGGEAPATPDAVGPLGGTLTGIGAAEITVAVLGILAVTGEYASGVVRSFFTAVPNRVSVVAGKAAVVGAMTLAISLALVLGTFATIHVLISGPGLDLSITGPGVLRSLTGAAVYLALVAVLGTALGWLLRSTAGALGVFLGLFYGLQILGLFLPAAVLRYLPSSAGGAIMQPVTGPESLSPAAGLAVFAGYVLLALFAAILVTRRRDA